jgi:hypothetical protein
MKEINKFENWLKEKYLLWTSDTAKYEDRVANFTISPKELQSIWLNKDQTRKVEPIDGIDFKGIIKNSISNRPPNYSNVNKRKQKISYLLGAISYVRDYNQLPVSLIIKEKGKLNFDNLLAKDRGTFNFYMTKMDEKQTIPFWKDIVNLNNQFEKNNRMKQILSRIEELIGKGIEFSVREAVPSSLLNEWESDEEMISIRMKYETYSNHSGEMDRMNNNPNPWVEHNHIMNNTLVPMVYEYPNVYKEETLNKAYDLVCKYALFSGSHKLCMTSIPNSTVEESEGFIPWMFHSLTYGKLTPLEIVSTIARQSETNTQTKSKHYKLAFQSKDKFLDEFTTSLEFMNIIANHSMVSSWVTEYNDYVDNNYPNARKTPTNIKDLRISKWDTFFTVVVSIKDIQTATKRTGKERLNGIVDNFFKSAIECLSDVNLMKELADTNGGLTTRFELFWEKVSLKTIDKLNLAEQGQFDVINLQHILKKNLVDSGMWGNNIEIYDRKSSTEFELIDISDFKNLQEGHLIPTVAATYGNIVLQPKGDNKFNNNHPIKNIDSYIDDYMSELNEFFENSSINQNPLAVLRTKVVLGSWNNQKEYTSII